MSTPDEIFDERLSSFLDGESHDAGERDQLESQLRDDPDVAAKYEAMKSLRQWVKAAGDSAATNATLGADFTRATVDAAVAEMAATRTASPAVDSGLTPSHLKTAVAANRRPKRWIGAAVAASIAVAVVLWSGIPSVDQRVAKQTDARESGAEDNRTSVGPDTADADTRRANRDAHRPHASAASGRDHTIARSGAANEIAETRAADTTRRRGSIGPGKVTTRGEQSVAAANVAHDSTDGSNSSRANAPSVARDSSAANVSSVANDFAPARVSSLVTVMRVRCTESGQRSDVFLRAMRRVGLSELSEQKITPEMVAAVGDSVGDPAVLAPAESAEGQLVYLRAPARKLDRLCLELFEDSAGISSVQFGLAMDVPIRRMVETMANVDPTTVRQGYGSRVPLGVEVMDGLRRRLDTVQYMPLDETSVTSMTSTLVMPEPPSRESLTTGLSAADSGNDVIAEMLFWVD